MASFDPSDVDLMARTMVAENNHGSADEYAAIANVMRNRMLSGEFGGTTMPNVIFSKNQFTPWNSPKAPNYPTKIDPRSPAYQSARSIAAQVMGGQGQDNTNGAVYYYNPKGVKKTPSFAKGREGTPIGDHVFYGPTDTIGENDYSHLITGKPQPSQVAGEEVAPSGPAKIGEDDYAHLITGKPAPKAPQEAPEPPPEPDISGGFGLVAKGFQKAPAATAAIAAPMAVGAAIPFAGAAAAGMSALPYWASIPLAGYGLKGIADLAGAPGTGEAIGTLMKLLRTGGEAMAP